MELSSINKNQGIKRRVSPIKIRLPLSNESPTKKIKTTNTIKKSKMAEKKFQRMNIIYLKN